MQIRQLFDRESSTYSYLLVGGGEAVLIDPVREQVERDLALVRELGVRLTHTIETHVHADHVTAAGIIRERTGAKTVLPGTPDDGIRGGLIDGHRPDAA